MAMSTGKKMRKAGMKLSFASPPPESADKSFEPGPSAAGPVTTNRERDDTHQQHHHGTESQSPSYSQNQSCQKQSSESLEERKAAFKRDKVLMAQTSKFVEEVIESARIEAVRRSQQTEKLGGDGYKYKAEHTIADWNNRARGFCNRVWNAILPCFNNNELLAWTQPLRYRFSRPP